MSATPENPNPISNDNDWKLLVESLVSLNGKGNDIKTLAQGTQDLSKNNANFLTKLNETLNNILNNVSTITNRSNEIVKALQEGKQNQDALVRDIANFAQLSRDNEDKIKNLMVESTQISNNIEKALNNSSAPATVGGKRRRTRNKGKKYHKRTKRGGYRYKKDKNSKIHKK